VAATGVSFSMSRWLVFRRRDGEEAPGRDGPRSSGTGHTLIRAKVPCGAGEETGD